MSDDSEVTKEFLEKIWPKMAPAETPQEKQPSYDRLMSVSVRRGERLAECYDIAREITTLVGLEISTGDMEGDPLTHLMSAIRTKLKGSDLVVLSEALRPLAALQVPQNRRGNAGAYSIRYSDIERAKSALDEHGGAVK